MSEGEEIQVCVSLDPPAVATTAVTVSTSVDTATGGTTMIPLLYQLTKLCTMYTISSSWANPCCESANYPCNSTMIYTYRSGLHYTGRKHNVCHGGNEALCCQQRHDSARQHCRICRRIHHQNFQQRRPNRATIPVWNHRLHHRSEP